MSYSRNSSDTLFNVMDFLYVEYFPTANAKSAKFFEAEDTKPRAKYQPRVIPQIR